jgi:hypothetical protein
MPEWLVEHLVAKRLWSGPETARTVEPEPDNPASSVSNDEEHPDGASQSHAVYTSSRLTLLCGNPHSTASNVVDWQTINHKGFVPAFISSIRYAPIHDQHHRWRVIVHNIKNHIGNLRKVALVLGKTDPIIVADELLVDARQIFGEEHLQVTIVEHAGHEVAISKAREIVSIVEHMQH